MISLLYSKAAKEKSLQLSLSGQPQAPSSKMTSETIVVLHFKNQIAVAWHGPQFLVHQHLQTVYRSP